MTTPENHVQVRKSEQTRLYEAVADGEVIGSLAYETAGRRIALTHSFVDPEHRNRGVGSALAEFALSDVAGSGARPSVYCGFVADYIDTHPQWEGKADVARLSLIPTRNTPAAAEAGPHDAQQFNGDVAP